MEKVTLSNTNISFTPNFLGNGWETSLLPKFSREDVSYSNIKINSSFFRNLWKMLYLDRRKESFLGTVNASS